MYQPYSENNKRLKAYIDSCPFPPAAKLRFSDIDIVGTEGVPGSLNNYPATYLSQTCNPVDSKSYWPNTFYLPTPLFSLVSAYI